MRFLILPAALLVLAACDHTVPDDAASLDMPISDEVLNAGADVSADPDAEGTEGGEGETDTAMNNPDISDTQNFEALTERVSAQEDKEFLASLKEQFQVVEATDLPDRPKGVLSVAEFALSTTHQVGEKMYSRFNPLGKALAARNCIKYRLADDAQAAFLAAGGPKRDPLGLDPDGDGFACDWDPETYRKLLAKS